MLSVDVEKQLGEFQIAVNFEAAGGATALFGPSGGGKTTILEVIAGTLRPDGGRVTLDDRVLVDVERGVCLPPEARHVGCVFQDQRLFPHLTVEGNLRYGLRRGTSRPVDFSRVVEVLDLGALLSRYPQTLSGGQQQRVAVARAFACHPPILLADEPTGNLDSVTGQHVMSLLHALHCDFGTTLVLVTHDRSIASTMERVIALRDGRIESDTLTDSDYWAAESFQ